ncbi:MAG: nucleotidyltransferase family protein [Anaerolineae bacterium]|nr:nucleotidyltransferase family protein [Anaerolineae bacterium]
MNRNGLANLNIALPRDEIAAFCRRHHIRKLALFGSVLRDDFRPDSDVDVLVEFEPGKTPDFFRFIDMQEELSAILRHKVDLNTPGFLSRHFRQKVLDTAEVVYERAGRDAAA